MPSNKLNEARTLYESEIRKVQKTSDKWKYFLNFAAKAQISKVQNEFEFSTKLIIHAINPKATDCRTFGEWKTQDGNHVNYGEHGITVLSRDSRGNQSVTYLFDTSQTALKKEPELLEIPEEIKENLKSALSNMVEKYSNNASFSDEQKRIFKASAEYKLCKQYGLETNDNAELFSGIEKLSVKEIANIGVSLNRCSQSFYEVVNNERRNFYDAHRINDSQSRNDRTELHGRESHRVDLGGGSSDAHEEVRLQRGAERVEQAERGTGSIRADVLDTSAEANSSNGQVRQHETEIHMENSVPDRDNNAERGTGGRGESAELSLRGNERASSESDRADSGEEETVGGIQDDRGIGTIPAESTNTGEVQGRSRGGNSSSDSLRNIINDTAEPEKVSAVSFSEKVHAAFAEVAENHVYSAKQQKFLDRLENFIVKRHITENLIDEMAKLPAFRTHYNNRNTLSRSVFAGRLGSLERELMQALKRQLREDAMDKAIRLIHEYCESEFDTKANLSNMDHIDIAYTTDEYSELPIEVYVDLETFRIVKEYDSVVVSETLYNSLEDMHGDLANLAFDELVALSDEEKNMVITAEENADIIEKTFSEITRDMYQTENPDIFVVKGKGSLAKIDISVSNELWDRLAEKGLVRNENSVDRIIFNTDGGNWNKIVIPDKWGNMTNNINIEDVLTREELLTAKSVADFVIKPENSIETVESIEKTEQSNEIQWTPIPETADEKGRPTSYSTEYNGKLYWISENSDGRYDIETKIGDRITKIGEEYSDFPTRDYAESAFDDYIEDIEKSFLSEKQALISVEIFGEEHYFKISDSSVDDILKTANTEKPLLKFTEIGERISGEEYAEIQQSDSFTYSVEMNLENDTASVYMVNDGNGGISEADRTDSNVAFNTVKISDYSDKEIGERIATDNLPETKFTSISDEARMYLDFHQYVPSPEVTPWGETQSCYEINKGIFDVTTASHGGIMIRSDIADKILSPEARKIGFREKGFHCFEEDCDIAVAYRELIDKKLFRDMNNFFEEWHDSTYEEKFEQFSNTTDEIIKRWFPDYWDKREQAIFNARPEEEQAAITGQMSLFGEISDIEDFPDFTEEENISDNAVISAENHEKEPSAKKSYFRITDEHLGEGSKREKFQNNIEAIKTLQILEAEECAATPEEQEKLSKYIGWGGLQEAFDKHDTSWEKEYNELKALLSEEEYEAARSTVRDAFYTSPVITQAIYEGLSNIGFEGGEILEPSMGIGNFFGTMPDKMRENSNLAGIEIDSISGRIAKKLYPEADIAINGYEKIKVSKGSFDLAVGNVPFGNNGVNDKTKAYSGLLIHDYFFAKSLDSVRSGGIVAFVTSTGTLDKEDIKVRQMLAQKAELLGAVRLPNNAFQKNAGTPTTTDIIFLKKREKSLNISDMPMDKSCDWVHTKENAEGLKINSYFADNPNMVLGKLADDGRFGSIVCHPIKGADLKEQLHEAMKNIKGEYIPLEFQQELDERAEDNYLTATPDIENLTYTVVDNKLYYRIDDSLIPLKESEQHGIVADRRKAMCGLGETVRELLQAQVEDRPDKEIKLLQAELNVKYDNFVKKFGRINPIETPNSRNASGVSRKAPNSNVFKNDVRLPLLQSLEKMQDGQFIGKTEIFTERTIRPRKVADHVDTAQEALILSISEKGRIDFDYMKQLTGFEKNKLIDDLHGDIYPVPELSTEDNTVYQTSDEYLSGNIYKKIAIAEAKLSENPAYAENIAALTEVMPKPLKATEIDMQLGMTWIDPKIIQQFMYETFETPTQFKEYDSSAEKENPLAITVSYSGSGKGSWKIENACLDNSVKSTKNFGTKELNAYELLEKILNAKSVAVTEIVKDPDTGSKKTVILEKETKAAEDKVKQINAAFKKWIFADPERRNELVKTYNEKFNGIRPREYDGSHLNFFGSNPEITLKPHQKNAVAHALFGGNTLFAHEVGAGKTFEMIATAMEGKRLGLHNKSLFVVPNHLTEQIGSDFMKLYPNANILVAKSDDFSPQKRRQMCARIATGNFDAVIIGHSQLIKIPLSPKREEEFIRKQINEIMTALEAAEETDSKSYTVKQLEATRKSLRERLEKLTNGTVKDNAVTFEELGVDKLFLDEAHEFKNLYVSTKMENVSGLSTNANVQKTQDLYMKCQYLDEITDGKGIVFSTGTPVTNALSEMFTTMKYLQSDLLKETGLDSFDAWAGNFTRKSTEAEISPSGSDWRMKTRLKFTNVPELVTMFKECADIKMSDQLNLDVPECEKHIVSVEPTVTQKVVVQSLAERAEKISKGAVSRTEDNMLVVTGDGRKLGLDQRLYDLNLPDEPQTKLNACIQNVFDIWDRTSDKKSTQLVFCDLGVPQSKEDFKKNGERFDVYADIRSKLIEKGVPEKEIAFIHDANSETEKAKLFAKVRSGDVRILIGSTQKMGAGTNVQDKLIALHDLDCPWRPADLTQRLGRMVRQGNENDKVDNFRYVTKGTFDAYLYQMVEKKQESIAQIFTSKAIARTCDDIDDMAVDFMQVKMAAVGDDRIRRQMELREDIRSLNMLKNTYLENKYEIEDNIKNLPAKIAVTENIINGIAEDTKAIEAYVPKKDIDGKDVFEMKIDGKTYTDKKEAAEALKNAIAKAIIGNPNKQTDIAEYKGFTIAVSYDSLSKTQIGYLKRANSYSFEFGSSESGNLTRIDNTIASVPLRADKFCNELERLKTELADSVKEADNPFEHEAELEEKKQELERLTDEINADKVKGEIPPEQPENKSPKTASNKEISDPFFMKVDSTVLSTLEKSGLDFEHCERNGETIIKFNRCDRDKINDIVSVQTKKLNQHNPKL